ncbi:nuclear transport factor 2 family protein [Mycobacterium sp. 236(2023)]|uniref:nuclear transport factor 2 family protein n=1 Tax=Mycobacterium sp. 236(2023) TaxID=3038163 RepID=UPI002415363C|nr:nuclear transport factor 2 family protein [Mycobacterium sp. 236(2023)]MDG4664891.1 nuclear transport factor 2 family protein [Mycobacterium sp. 236(2023)]
MNIQALADEIDIGNLLTRYCRAVDSKDWELYRSLLTDDAHLDYSAAGLFVGGPDDAVAYLTRHQKSITVGMHYVTNIESQIDEDDASVVAMWFNAVRLPEATDMSFFHGRWHDRLIRTAEGWQIQNLRLEVVA